MRELKKTLSDYFKDCIFCLKPLTTKRREHVLPENILGFWTIDVICNDCAEHFGNKVDHLAIKDLRILEAMDSLGYKVKNKYAELPYKAQDTLDKKEIKGVYKRGKFKSKVINKDNILEFPTEKFNIIAPNWLRKKSNISEKEFNEEIEKIKRLIPTLKAGGKYNSEKLGCSIINRQANNVKIDTENIPSITPLIAKIVICLLFSFIPANQFVKLKILDELRDHARYNGNVTEGIIYPIIPLSKKKYSKFHFMKLNIYEKAIEINIIFFGYLSWLIKLHSDDKILIPFNKSRIEEIIFITDFRDKRKGEICIECANGDKHHEVFPAYK